MLPTAMVAIPTSWRIRSLNGVWNWRPYSGFASGTVWPADTSTMSQPCSRSILATSTASSGSIPPGTQSTAEIRADSGLSGQT